MPLPRSVGRNTERYDGPMSSGGQRGEILFHHPHPLLSEPRSGSQNRPVQMLRAFREIGFTVVEVTGYSDERVPHMRELIGDVERGRRFEFCYSESVTSPTALSDPQHLPKHPIADPRFFHSLRKHHVPVGLFYRDVHWRFDQYRETVPLTKRAVANVFYQYDLLWYSKVIDIVYVPDLGMTSAIPGASRLDFRALPPGTNVRADWTTDRNDDRPLSLVYIGSVSPPHNDISPLLRAVSATPGVELTISCPESEVSVLAANYPDQWLDGIHVLHLNSAEAADLYDMADISCLIYEPHAYRDFAMPVKLFEAIGHRTPSLSMDDSAAGRFIRTQGAGWAVKDEEQLRSLLRSIVEDRGAIDEKRRMLDSIAASHTWTARASTVADDLIALNP